MTRRKLRFCLFAKPQFSSFSQSFLKTSFSIIRFLFDLSTINHTPIIYRTIYYPTPNIIDQNYDEILQAISFVDKIVFGRLNYNPDVSEYKGYKEYYNNLSKKTIAFCVGNGKEYHIKTGTITVMRYSVKKTL